MSDNKKQPVSELTETAMANLRSLVDVNTIIGDPITTSDGITIIPISKVTFGYGSGGSELGNGSGPNGRFAGGSGGGVTLHPLGFLVINGADIRLLQMQTADNTGDRLVNAGAGAVNRLLDLLPQNKKAQDISGIADDEDLFDQDF